MSSSNSHVGYKQCTRLRPILLSRYRWILITSIRLCVNGLLLVWQCFFFFFVCIFTKICRSTWRPNPNSSLLHRDRSWLTARALALSKDSSAPDHRWFKCSSRKRCANSIGCSGQYVDSLMIGFLTHSYLFKRRHAGCSKLPSSSCDLDCNEVYKTSKKKKSSIPTRPTSLVDSIEKKEVEKSKGCKSKIPQFGASTQAPKSTAKAYWQYIRKGGKYQYYKHAGNVPLTDHFFYLPLKFVHSW